MLHKVCTTTSALSTEFVQIHPLCGSPALLPCRRPPPSPCTTSIVLPVSPTNSSSSSNTKPSPTFPEREVREPRAASALSYKAFSSKSKVVPSLRSVLFRSKKAASFIVVLVVVRPCIVHIAWWLTHTHTHIHTHTYEPFKGQHAVEALSSTMEK